MANRIWLAARRVGMWGGLIGGLSVGACVPQVSNHGYRLDEAALAQIEPGRTTRDEVLQLLGSPSTLTTFDGSVWYYVSQRTERMSFYQEDVVNRDVLSVTFDELGAVAQIDRHGLEQGHEVNLVGRETPTAGSELTALEQFIGNIGRFNPPADADRR
ncbi:MAG TPA: outer membrane protein assembly factor BamE [Geminicoccaceae bacterium]|jgi:outer membrane protein assembly factor BamE (lipoprotein component of BamABCDE complex)|nr:outer membrane protein assembly factor BamE [Geminicoccaceae bacterium]